MISGKQRMDLQLNKAKAKLMERHMFGEGATVTDEQLLSLYQYNVGIRRVTPPHDPSFEHFYYETKRLTEIIACREYYREDGVAPDMAVNFQIRPGVKDQDVYDLHELYGSRFRAYTWLGNGHGVMHAVYSLSEVPAADLTDFLAIAREMAHSTLALDFQAVKGSALSWTD